MDLLSQRKNEEIAIFRAFAERTLKQHAERMEASQREAMSGSKSSFWNQLQVNSNDHSIDMRMRPEMRFVDMRSRYVKSSKKRITKGYHDVYNKIVMTHYNGILMDLTYGMSEAIVQEMKNSLGIK